VTTAVPVWEHGRLKAVIALNNKVVGAPITDEELELVFALGNQLAVAIENASLVGLISRQRNYLENILNNVSSAVISVDNNEVVATYNTKAEEILGISSAEVIGKSVNLLPHDISSLIKDTIHTGVPIYRRELKLLGLDKFVGVSISAIRDGQGNISGAAMIFTDLAPIKALEEQTRRSDRLDFTNTVAMRSSHELKNCLVSIKTFAQLLPERYSDKQFREDFYLVVNKEVDRLNQVVENLLFFAQPLKLDLTIVNIGDLVQEVMEIIDKDEMLDGVVVKKEFRHNASALNFDRDAIRRALKHLFYNSIQAMPKGGTIQVITDNLNLEGKNVLEMKIIDDGIGIPEEIIEKIWEPFFTTKTRGIGLGLTIVQKIIEAHGGSISAVSKAGISGSEFILRLPCGQERKNTEKLYFPSGRAVIV
jgi:PAS domain S-box-containing protein